MIKLVNGNGKYEYMVPLREDDLYGEDALFAGGDCYESAMSIDDPADHEERIRLFQAAEQLYLQSAERGNAIASMCLGYVYSYDRCEGRYWRGKGEECERPYPREERAFECFSVAAEADIPEACYKLGDMYKEGVGCNSDAASAYEWYIRASKLAMDGETPVVLGSIALRLAWCLEEGFGCEQSFSCALQMYHHAVRALEAAVDVGETWYEKALASAQAGVMRCKQEVF